MVIILFESNQLIFHEFTFISNDTDGRIHWEGSLNDYQSNEKHSKYNMNTK